MSLAIWPPVSAEERQAREAETLRRELVWITGETLAVCDELKHGLEDCYALLAPVDPGSTLVMSTHRNEKVKGTITRVGTRILKASLNLQLRTVPAQTVSLSPSNPIHLRVLDTLHTHLTQCIDLLGLILSRQPPFDGPSLASTLDLIADSLAESTALLKGPSLSEPDSSWQTASCSRHHFSPPLSPNISLYIGLQESSIVLTLRALEPVRAPLQLSTKLGLAIGTVRRLEHDEMDLVFRYHSEAGDAAQPKVRLSAQTPTLAAAEADSDQETEVYVREKVRVESADPSLISISSKLLYLSHMLGQARRNLAAVMGTETETEMGD